MDKRPDEELRQGFIGSQEGEKTSNRFLCSLPRQRVSVFLKWAEWGLGGWLWPEEGLRWSAHLLGGAAYRVHGQYPAFALDTSEVAVELGSFCILLFIICPNFACIQLFLFPYSFFAFCCWRRHLSRYKHCSKGTLVPASLKNIQFNSVTQSFLTVCDPRTTARQASLSITNSWYLLKLMSTELVMPSNHLIFCRPLLLPSSIFPSIRAFSNESVLIRWPK